MKKSKVLKKSLSLLLAVLLVVAMVPFGAAAAEPVNPTLAELRVGGKVADIDQSTKTISVIKPAINSFHQVKIQYLAKDGNGELYIGSGYELVTSGNEYDLSAYKVIDNLYSVPLRIQDPVNAGFFTDYTLKVQSEEIDSDLTIEKFTIDGQVGSTFATGKLSFEILMPYNRVLDGAAINELKTNIKLTSDDSDHNWVETPNNNAGDYEPIFPDYDPKSYAYFTVTGEDGSTQEYEVIIRRAEAITSFDIPNNVPNQSTFTYPDKIVWPDTLGTTTAYPGEDVMTGGEINIYIPKNAMANASYLDAVVPTFTSELGDVQPTKVELWNGTKLTELKTGVTAVNLSAAYQNNAALYIIATYPANVGGAKAVYALHIDEEPTGSRTAIQEASIASPSLTGMINYAEITDDTIKFDVSQSMDLRNVDLTFTLPVDAEISFPTVTPPVAAQTVGGANEYGSLVFTGMDLRKPVVLQVESGTGVIKTYTVSATKVEVPAQDAKFKSVYLKNNATGVVYEADAESLKGVHVTFTVPRGTKPADLNGFTLYYSAPLGASITYKTSATGYSGLPKSGTVLSSGNPLHIGQYGIVPTPKYDSMDTTEIVVKTYDDNSTTVNTTNYIVGFKYNEWVKDNKIQSGSFKLTRGRTVGEIEADTTYTGTVKTVNKTSAAPYGDTGNVTVVEVSVPYMDYENLQFLQPNPISQVKLADLGISDYAALYVEDSTLGGGTANRYYPLGDPNYNNTQTFDFWTNGPALKSVNDTVYRLFVLNEKGIYDLDTAGSISTAAIGGATDPAHAGNVTQYYLVVKVNAARSSAGLKSLSAINSKDQERAAVVKNDSIVLNVPWSWARGDDAVLSTTDDANTEMLHFDFETNPGNLFLELQSQATLWPGGFKDTDGNYMPIAAGDVYFRVSKTGLLYIVYDNGSGMTVDKVQTFYVEAENGAVKQYSVEVNILPIQSGAEIKSFSVNGVAGTISGDTIKVTLPFGSKYDDVAPVFTTSDMATVVFDDTGVEILSGVTELDFTKTVNLTVRSEDSKATTKYKVIVEAPMQFSDVKPGSWYYDAVMEAAGLGIVNGYSDGTFKPGNPVNRADFVLMLTRAMGVTEAELNTYTNNPFMDVAIDSYYAKAVAWASDKGYVTGYDNADFKPTKNITRQEAATIYCRVMGLAEVTNPSESVKYKDHGAIAPWAVGYVYAVQNAGIMSGHSDGTFTPQNNLTRAQTAQAMVNYYHVK